MLILEPRTLLRERLAQALGQVAPDLRVVALRGPKQAVSSKRTQAWDVIVYASGSHSAGEVQETLAYLVKTFPAAALVVLGETDESEAIMLALNGGARGYVSTSMSLEGVADAIRCVASGERFVPLTTWDARGQPN